MRVLHVTNMYPTPERPALGAFVKTQVDSLVEAGVTCDVLFVDGVTSRFHYIKGLLTLVRRVSGTCFDLVHAHYAYSGLLASLARRVPLIVSFCGENELAWRLTAGRGGRARVRQACNVTLSRFVMGWADRIIVKSRRMERMVPAGYRARTSVIPNGVDLEGFRPMERTEARRRLGLRQDMSYVLFPGDPGDPNKGYELVSDAVDILARRGTACEVVFLKGIPHGDVPLYMNATDVMAFASHHEGSPNVIKEGLACDMPIVSVEVGDVPERLSGLRGARLVPRDPHLFAEALFDIIREGARSEGRPRVRDLSLPAVARRLIDLYEETLATGRGDRPCAAS